MAGCSILLAASLAFLPVAEIRGETVRLGDVADVSVLPRSLRSKAAALPLARFSRDAAQARVAGRVLAAQARSRLPALAVWLPADKAGFVTLRRPVSAGTPRVHGVDSAGVVTGEGVRVTVRAGGFHVEREARVLTAARVGERLFVRTADRQVIAGVLEGAQ